MTGKNKLSQGLVQVYTGKGKGKTTSALGLGLRAVGHGFKVTVVQYLKGNTFTGELYAAEKLPGFTIKQFGKGCPYAAMIREGLMECIGCGVCSVREGEQSEQQEFVNSAYQYSKEILREGETDIVILDEINNALRFELLTVEQVQKLIELKGDHTELILTGREIPREIIELADLVTEMKAVKHPYKEQGIRSRRGVEY